MAEWSDLNSVADENVSAVNSVAIANISTINGLATPSGSSYEDFTTFTIGADENSDLTVTSTKIDIDTLRRDATTYVYKDYTANYFDDFEIQFEVETTAFSANNATFSMGLSNTIGDFSDFISGNDGLYCTWIKINTVPNIRTAVGDRDTPASNSFQEIASVHPLRYYTWTRSGTALTLNAYSDSGRSSLVFSRSATVTTAAKRYLYGMFSRNDDASGTAEATGYIQNLEIVSVA